MTSGVRVLHGIPPHEEAATALPASSRGTLDAAVSTLRAARTAWAAVAARERREILDRVIREFLAVADRWAAVSLEAKGIEPGSPASAEEWIAGPFCVLRNLRLLRDAMADIERFGRPRIPGPVRTCPDGRVAAQVFPVSLYDRLFYRGVTAEVRMQRGVTAEGLPGTQAPAYRDAGRAPNVTLVLGAGNVSSIGPMDMLYRVFVENDVVLYKAHPVNAYLGPLMEEAFRALVERDALRVVYGGAAEGAYLCHHPGVDEIHLTGSDKTYEAIVFGTGAEGARRKAEGRPLLTKRVTAELGNVSPVIVVPGPWSKRDLRYQAANVVSMLTNNAGFNCNATRVVVQHSGWPLRRRLLDAVRTLLAGVPLRNAYYPGASDRLDAFLAVHPNADRLGGDGPVSDPPGTAARTSARGSPPGGQALPWVLIPDVDPGTAGDVCFTTEAFCGLFAESAVEAPTVPEFMRRAVAFANERLWGSLNVTILVHPRSLEDAATAGALEQAIADLRYGTVSINHWAAIGYALAVTTWGAYPGHEPTDIQSGTGVVHNTLMFSKPEKSVVRAPFTTWPKPPWFVTHRAAAALGPKLARFEAGPSWSKVPGILWDAVRG